MNNVLVNFHTGELLDPGTGERVGVIAEVNWITEHNPRQLCDGPDKIIGMGRGFRVDRMKLEALILLPPKRDSVVTSQPKTATATKRRQTATAKKTGPVRKRKRAKS